MKTTDIGEIFTGFILRNKYSSIVTLLLITFVMTTVGLYADLKTHKKEYDDLYRHKENILNELLSQGTKSDCDTTLYYSLDEISPEAMFVDTLIIDNPSVIIHCNGYWNRLKGTLRGKKGDAVIKCDIYVNNKKLRMKSVCADYY